MGLQKYREEIDRIDGELLRLFAERMAVSGKIAVYKRENGLPVLDEAREREKLAEIEQALPIELRQYGAALYERMFALSRDWQEHIGAKGAENILLIGMPGCGKTTVSRALAKALGRDAFDCDELVEARCGAPIPELFARRGEEAFRKLETEALAELCRSGGRVIATGGGCVTRQENAPLLRGGTVVWLRRDLAELPVEGRPISMGRDLRELYAERAPLYECFADIVVDNDGTIGETVERIITALKLKKEDA